MALTLTSINRYPIKSCRRDEMPQAEVEPWGLSGDRRWMLVDDEGEVVTARERHQLLLVTPVLDGTALRLHAPGRPSLTVKVPDGELATVTIWRSRIDVMPAAPEAHAWFSELAGMALRLVYLTIRCAGARARDSARRAIGWRSPTGTRCCWRRRIRLRA